MKGGDKLIYPELSYKIVGILFDVYNSLGYGYKETYYQKAVEVTFKKNGIIYIAQAPYKVRYMGEIIGRNYIDLIIENKIVLELKQGKRFTKNNFEQVIRYLKATNMKLAILASFTKNGLIYSRVLNIY